MANTPNTETTTVFSKLGFYGAVPVSQRASSNQAVSLLSATSASSAYNVTEANYVYLAVKEIVSTLTGLGLWKGSA